MPARVLAQQALASAPAARPAMQPTPSVAPKPAPVAAPAPAAMPEAGSSSEISNALEGWRAAWSRRDVDAYLGFYAPGFVPSNEGGRDAWKEKRKAVLGRAVDISVEMSELSVATPDATHATATFRQTYRSANYRDVVTKTLQWERVGDRWLIVRESSVTPVQGLQ